MKATFRPIDSWPGELTPPDERQQPPFTARWSDTLELLDRELGFLEADHVVVQLALDESQIRLDGWPRSDARPEHPGVIVAFDSKHGPLKYATDVFESGTRWIPLNQRSSGEPSTRRIEGWQANLRAIALGLEALRKVDRYGITRRGEQYTGWKALGAGIPMGPGQMTVEGAAQFIAEHGGIGREGFRVVLDDDDTAKLWYRSAAKRLHPDAGGDPEQFRRLQEAYELLQAHTR